MKERFRMESLLRDPCCAAGLVAAGIASIWWIGVNDRFN